MIFQQDLSVGWFCSVVMGCFVYWRLTWRGIVLSITVNNCENIREKIIYIKNKSSRGKYRTSVNTDINKIKIGVVAIDCERYGSIGQVRHESRV